MFLKADVVYDSNVTSAADIAQAIDDLGFACHVLEDSANNNEKVHLLVSSRTGLTEKNIYFTGIRYYVNTDLPKEALM
jgi:hypothetical protein